MNTLFLSLPAIAHLLIGFYFIFFGFWNVYHWFPTMEAMAKRGVPHPYIVLPVAILWQTIAGALIIAGLFVKLAAVSLIVFTLISIIGAHPFWQFRGEHRIIHFKFFAVNLTVVIGALILLVWPMTQVSDFLS